ncbi:hypothetical protein J1N35_018455, partial [Gossypium stocksii]
VSWRKPPSNVYILNIDGNIRMLTQSAATGGLIRDEHGSWLAGLLCKIGSANSLHAELWD